MTAHPFEKQPHGGQTTLQLRPKDAASILVLDRSNGMRRVLVGKRGKQHAFMPNVYVFPGGRRDRTDYSLPFDGDLHPSVIARLSDGQQGAVGIRRARALALAAVRELREETGLVLGRRERHRDRECLISNLSTLRYVARAVTPPGNIRRFDTRFFATFTDEAGISVDELRDSDELHDLQWLDIDAISSLNIPAITRTILEDVKAQMNAQPSLPFGSEGPHYFTRRGQFLRGRF